MDGLAFVVQSLGDASCKESEAHGSWSWWRSGRCSTGTGSSACGTPSRRQSSLLRQAVFTRTEDPRIEGPRSRIRTSLISFGEADECVAVRERHPSDRRLPCSWTSEPRRCPSPSPDHEQISGCSCGTPERPCSDDAHGAAPTGWSLVDGLQAMILNLACAVWIAQLSSAAEDRPYCHLNDVQRGIGRVDRHVGRAPLARDLGRASSSQLSSR